MTIVTLIITYGMITQTASDLMQDPVDLMRVSERSRLNKAGAASTTLIEHYSSLSYLT